MNKNLAKSLLEKHGCVKNKYYSISEEPYKQNHNANNEQIEKVCEKWSSHVAEGWYGFDGLGTPTPLVWYDVIDEFFDEVKKECPDFKILQLKIKFGGFRMYLENTNDTISANIWILEECLCDDKLVY